MSFRYRNNPKNREFDQEVPLNLCSEQAPRGPQRSIFCGDGAIALGQGASENKNSDSSDCFGMDAPAAKPKKLLIITSSGGGGLIQAANAKEQEARAADPNIVIKRIDILNDWMGKSFGTFCSEKWNRAQMKGDLTTLRFVIWAQFILDYFSWPYIFIRALITLFKEDVDHVIDTQPLGTAAVLKAMRIYNQRRNKQLRLQKVLVDLPTKSATHFFRSIKHLSKNNRPLLQLTTIAPMLEVGQTAEDFWQTNCRLSEREILYEDVNVRQAFRKFRHKRRDSNEFPVFIRFKTEEELQLIKKSIGKGTLRGLVKGNEIHFSISPRDQLITLLLGSQPASESTFHYVKKFMQLAQEADSQNRSTHIFVFSSEHKSQEDSLFRKVVDFVANEPRYPKKLTIIPFSFQNDDCIAPLFFRSDLTCTRSGGQTAMELMCVSTGEMLIHSEAKLDSDRDEELSLEQLLEGIPGWEAENALYLKKVCNAQIVTPETIAPLARKFFQANMNKDRSTQPLESLA